MNRYQICVGMYILSQFFKTGYKMAVSFLIKTLYRLKISRGFSCFWFCFQVLIHTISTLTFRTIAKACLPYQDAVIIIFKMAFKKAAMISCAKLHVIRPRIEFKINIFPH